MRGRQHDVETDTAREHAEERRAATEEIARRTQELAETNALLTALASLPLDEDVRGVVARELRRATGAAAAWFNSYDPQSRMLRVRGIAMESGVLQKGVALLGRRLEELEFPVSDEMHREILGDIVGRRESLIDISFGTLPKAVGAATQKLLGAGYFLGLAHVIDGELFGTSVLAMRAAQPEPTRAWLESLAHAVAVSLRRRVAEEALQASEASNRLLLRRLPDGVLVLDANARITFANEKASALLGLPAEALQGASLADSAGRFLRDDGAPMPFEEHPISRALATREPVKGVTIGVTKPGAGGVAWCQVGAFPELEGSELKRVVVTCMDVTERKRVDEERRRMEASLAQSDRLASMGMLAAGVAHEINNPLAFVLYNLESVAADVEGCAERLGRLRRAIDDLPAAAPLRAALLPDLDALDERLWTDLSLRFGDALAGARRITEITRGLGAFSRVERDATTLVDLRVPIQSAISIAHNEIRYRGKLEVTHGSIAPVVASEGRLSQVFLNLLINAAHAIGEDDAAHNSISVRTWQDGDTVCAEVSDTGCGIAPEQLGRLFEPFFTTKPPGLGSGLGLTIARSIVNGYGGTIAVESEVGRGTRFTLRFPAAKRETPSGQASRPPEAAANERSRVLVVDDEPAVRRVLKRILRAHDVVEAGSGAEACELLATDQRFDVILCDMMMPGMSGMDLYGWLATRHSELASRVVFVTGGAFTPNARAFLEMVENPHVEKPVDADQLCALVARLVRKGRRRG